MTNSIEPPIESEPPYQKIPGLTDDESKQWCRFACGSRCLLQLRAFAKAPVPVKEYVTQFRDQFNPGQLGAIDVSEIVRIAYDLELSKKVYAFRNRAVVRREIQKKVHRAVLLLTDRDKGENEEWGDYFHCRLFRGFASDGNWVFWHPNADGRDFLVGFSESDLDDRFAHFLVLH